jgi:hypothetical protein
MPNVVEAIPGMNNIPVILRNPESLAPDAISVSTLVAQSEGWSGVRLLTFRC